jgi:hypothetical protein
VPEVVSKIQALSQCGTVKSVERQPTENNGLPGQSGCMSRKIKK